MSLNHSLHREKMLEIVHAIFSSPIAKYCAFKGGTLALFIYQLDRFSTDVDIDLLVPVQEQLVIETIDRLLLPIGRIKNKVVGKNLHRRTLSYGEADMNIKVELNKRISLHNVYETTSLYGIDCKVMSPISSATNKLIALSVRFANRDLYDTRYFRKLGRSYDPALIFDRTGKEIKPFIQECIDQIPHHYKKNTILYQLGEVLTDKQKARVKNNLVDESIQLLTFYLRGL